MKRLEHDANTLEEVLTYYQTRARQLIFDGFLWSGKLSKIEGGFETEFFKNDAVFKSFYILKDYRSLGLASKAIKCKEPIVTVPDCGIVEFLQHHKKEHQVVGSFNETKEYLAIQDYYGDKKASRSGCFLMNHIDEGIFIMKSFGASNDAIRAFCVHPLVQNTDELKLNWEKVHSVFEPKIIALAMEYRNIANAYLSHRKIDSIEEIELSPIKDVNDMLIGDKIQNFKDFIIYHSKTHPRKMELDKYFQDWLQKLEISKDDFESMKKQLLTIEF